MSASLRLAGVAASSGYAEGPIFDLDRNAAAYAPKDSPAAETEALMEAIATATERLAERAAGVAGEAADMLEFQLAMLSDDGLYAPALAAVAEGAPADAAWRTALDAEIAGYLASPDEYFRARAADLADIRDQVLRALSAEAEAAIPPGAILYGEDIAPTRFLDTDWSAGGGIALGKGSASSHVAMLARSRGVPMVVGLGQPAGSLSGLALLDAEHGAIVVQPSQKQAEDFGAARHAFTAARDSAKRYLDKPAVTARGTPVTVKVNVADPADVDRIDISTCDGVGLMRTEFLFGKALPDEETQLRACRKVLEWASGKPVTIRTVDAGGDKPVPGFTVEESNPFLGLRGIRLALSRPDVFRVQIRALLRAAEHGNLRVMLPMVTVPAEFAQASALFGEELAKLAAAGVAARMPPLGIMVEVPSVAITPERFSDAAFLSIGSNDLTQYVTAAARDNGAVAHLGSVLDPAVLRLIEGVATFGRNADVPVGLCGDAGGDPAAIPALLAAGLRELSVAPAQLAAAKAAIANAAI